MKMKEVSTWEGFVSACNGTDDISITSDIKVPENFAEAKVRANIIIYGNNHTIYCAPNRGGAEKTFLQSASSDFVAVAVHDLRILNLYYTNLTNNNYLTASFRNCEITTYLAGNKFVTDYKTTLYDCKVKVSGGTNTFYIPSSQSSHYYLDALAVSNSLYFVNFFYDSSFVGSVRSTHAANTISFHMTSTVTLYRNNLYDLDFSGAVLSGTALYTAPYSLHLFRGLVIPSSTTVIVRDATVIYTTNIATVSSSGASYCYTNDMSVIRDITTYKKLGWAVE